jgi:predicted PhzF superfamily epimerase YddE/YHI9
MVFRWISPLTWPDRAPVGLLAALGLESGVVLDADDYIVVVEGENIVDALAPDFNALNAFDRRGVVVTAPSSKYDFVSRWFGPRVGVNEDPVTGSAHTWLALPIGPSVSGKTVLSARQGGKRQGTLTCEIAGDRVIPSGEAILYLSGEIEVPDTA